MEKVASVNRGNVNVIVAVIVIVADSASHSVHFNIKASLVRHIGEGAVVVVMVKSRVGFVCRMPWPVHRIDKKNVLPPIVVVVDETRAAAHRFRKVFLAERSTISCEMNSRLSGDVGKGNWP